jgi:beta-dihydromenaquinone-9 omega-hydroxylase
MDFERGASSCLPSSAGSSCKRARMVKRGAPAPIAYDPFSPAVIADPYPWYRRLLGEAQVYREERHDVWVVSRYDEVRAAARDHVRLSSAEGVAYRRAPLPMILTMDPPDHTRLRRLVARDFSPRAIERWRPLVERLVREVIAEIVERGTVDFTEVVAGPLPVAVIAQVLGIPREDYARFKRWSDGVVEGFKVAGEVDPAAVDLPRITRAIEELRTYFLALFAERRRRPGEDLVSRLLQPLEHERLTASELFWFCFLLLVAGNETTTNLLGNMLLAFVENPAEWERLRRRPELARSAVNEGLRYDAPIQGFFRTAIAPYPIRDAVIMEGSRVLLLFGAANRDPRRYPDPDRFSIERDSSDHLAFGSGIHQCLGESLAQMEGGIVLRELADRVRAMEFAGEVVRTANPTLRGVARLPLRLAAA